MRFPEEIFPEYHFHLIGVTLKSKRQAMKMTNSAKCVRGFSSASYVLTTANDSTHGRTAAWQSRSQHRSSALRCIDTPAVCPFQNMGGGYDGSDNHSMSLVRNNKPERIIHAGVAPSPRLCSRLHSVDSQSQQRQSPISRVFQEMVGNAACHLAHD
jgi:hypothetical protein